MNSWIGDSLPLAIVFIGFSGMLVFLWQYWRVQGPVGCRIYMHCMNFLLGIGLGLGILVAVIGFLWDIGVINASA